MSGFNNTNDLQFHLDQCNKLFLSPQLFSKKDIIQLEKMNEELFKQTGFNELENYRSVFKKLLEQEELRQLPRPK